MCQQGTNSNPWAGYRIGPTQKVPIVLQTWLGTSYFWSEVIGKTAENAVSDGLGWNLSKTINRRSQNFYTLVADYRPHKSAGYDVTSWLCSSAKCN